jgi:hypothetical protein
MEMVHKNVRLEAVETGSAAVAYQYVCMYQNSCPASKLHLLVLAYLAGRRPHVLEVNNIMPC